VVAGKKEATHESRLNKNRSKGSGFPFSHILWGRKRRRRRRYS
jgi:hypothetical protein